MIFFFYQMKVSMDQAVRHLFLHLEFLQVYLARKSEQRSDRNLACKGKRINLLFTPLFYKRLMKNIELNWLTTYNNVR